MSRIVHRKPTWTWSLVLLSTLLLTPSTAAVVLAALRQANVALAPAETLQPVAPRRATTEEEEALKAAAQSGRLKLVRLEPTAETQTLAILAPTRLTIALPEQPSAAPCTCTSPLVLRSTALRACGSRAPPHA